MAHRPPVFVLPRVDTASSSSPNSHGSPATHSASALSQAASTLSLAELALPVPPPLASTSRIHPAPTSPPPPALATAAAAVDQPHEDPPKPAKGKRGRKRIAEPLDNIKGASSSLPVSRPRRRLARPVPDLVRHPPLPPSDNPSLDAEAKRKLQNRAAQRAFRERKEKHTADLEERVKVQEAQLDAFKEILRRCVASFSSPPAACERRADLACRNRLLAENEALRSGANPPRTDVSLDLVAPSAPEQDSTSAHASHATNGADAAHTTSPEDVKPAVSRTPTSPPPDPVPSSSHLAPVSTSQPPPALAPPSLPIAPPHEPAAVPPPPVLDDTLMPAFDDLNFDFEAPFDFSDSVALPPLFTSMIDGTGATGSSLGVGAPTAPPSSTSAAPRARDAYDDDTCPGDDDDEEPPALPEGGIPCAECDFSQQSCSLPIPWRPPTVSDEKHLWLAQKCWAKLLSHPLFSQVDPVRPLLLILVSRRRARDADALPLARPQDDLCAELRARTRCSTDGRLVCHKSDVCDIFRSIPHKAKLRAQALSMR